MVFATCEEPREWDRLRELAGQTISVNALPDAVTWEIAIAPKPPLAEAPRRRPRIPSIRLNPEAAWFPLERATPETTGGKANAARRLAELARTSPGFHTPRSLVVPFGVLEQTLSTVPGVAAEYRALKEGINGLPLRGDPRPSPKAARLPGKAGRATGDRF